MFLIRKIGKTLRGQAKPYQVISAAILGGLVGFAPPFTQAPMYLIAVALLLAVLNANFFIATFTAGIAKLLALALLPVSFELGLVLVDGPLQPLFRTLINAPVFALMGFDYYATAGGLVLGIVCGGLLGVGYVKLISGFRKKMAKVEAESEKYADYVSKRSVRILMWVLFGGKAKLSYAELMEQKKIGNPVRPLGIVFAALVVVLLFIVQQFFSGPIVKMAMQNGLEDFNGATVDVDGVVLDLKNGELTVDRLAMADRDALDKDLIRANQLSAKVSTADLLRKRIVIDSVVIDDATSGETRKVPGVLIGERPEPAEPTGEGKSIEEWFEKAKSWKQRLETWRDWYEKIKGPPKDEDASEDSAKDRLRRWAERTGYASVRASHLVEGAPTVLVRDVKINKLRATWPEGETLDVHATNLSTQPSLVAEKPRVTVVSSGDSFDLNLAVAPRSRPEEQSELAWTVRNRSVDQTLADLDLGSQTTLTGGTWQAGMNGMVSDSAGLDMLIVFVLENTQLSMPSIQPTMIDHFPFEFGVNGPLDAPRLQLDVKKFTQTLLEQGGNAIAGQYIRLGSDKIKEQLGGDVPGELGGLIDGLIGGRQNSSTGDEEDNDQPSVEDKIREGIGGFLNRDKDE